MCVVGVPAFLRSMSLKQTDKGKCRGGVVVQLKVGREHKCPHAPPPVATGHS